MKDTKITGSKIKKEVVIFLFCLLASAGLNVYSIFKLETDWSELISQLPMVLFISIIIYILVLTFRLIFIVFERLTKSK